ncbi:ParA family protein [Rossellomorea marisflavi]|uniref:ParA family protein n=1 Tax=Rossellomorea marisflavi TaxID=189381 RepID=UPI001EE155A3|nr:ParA family protein [Rossellomorea marisflavi]UKS67701.1 ParA family protein [Rossellomorea marisflavi]
MYTTVMNKGGCLKTSITTNIGSQLSLQGKKVLIIDLDEQRNVLMTFQINNTEFDIENWLLNEVEFDSVKVNVSSGLDIVNGPQSLYKFEKKIKEANVGLSVLKEKIDEVREQYDYVIIDTPPSFSITTSIGMAAANELLVPFQPEMYGSAGLVRTIDQIDDMKANVNPDARIKRVIPTKIVKRSKHHRKVVQECEQFLSSKGIELSKVRIWDTMDGVNSIFEEKRPPVLSRKSNKLKQVYRTLAKEVTS